MTDPWFDPETGELIEPDPADDIGITHQPSSEAGVALCRAALNSAQPIPRRVPWLKESETNA